MKDLNIKNIQPTKGYVLVEPTKAEEKTVSGIILPENESEKPQYGVVLAVGACDCGCDCDCDCDCESSCDCGCGETAKSCDESCDCSCGCDCESGDIKKTDSCCSSASQSCSCEAPVKVGDKVIYKKWGGNEFKIADTEYQFLKFEDILAIIK